MKTLVIYQSSTGFTKQYAEWIAAKLHSKAVDLKHVTEDEMNSADQIVFGGWIMANMIQGLEKIRKRNPKKLTVFAVGSVSEELVDIEEMKCQNKLETTPFYYFVGGFHFEQLNFVFRTMLKTMKKSLIKKENKDGKEQYMAEHLGTSFDYSDIKYIKPLVDNVLEEEISCI